jgi:hypothetical protein
MAINVNYALKNTLATAYKNAAVAGALFSATPGTTGTATNELTGGGYARQTISWGTVANGAVATSSNIVFSVASGATVSHFGVCSSTTATTADVQDWYDLVDQTFSSAGTYSVSANVTVS